MTFSVIRSSDENFTHLITTEFHLVRQWGESTGIALFQKEISDAEDMVQFQRGMSLSESCIATERWSDASRRCSPGAGRRASLARRAGMRGAVRSRAGVCFSATPALDRPR